MKQKTKIQNIRLTSPQRAALAGALRFGLQKSDRFGQYHQMQRPQLTLAAPASMKALMTFGLIERSKYESFDFVASARGRRLGALLGLDTKVLFDAPKTLAERAVTLRLLTTPATWACGDTQAYAPPKLSRRLGRGILWVEQMRYGNFRSDADGTLRLVLTPKGEKLVAATDAPITIPLTAEMQRHLRAGALNKVMLRDVGRDYRSSNSLSLGTVDSMDSPRDLHERLYDPMAVFPGTLVRLVDAKNRKLIATARAAEWDRIWFRANEAYGRAIFDMNYEYARFHALDQYDRRLWVAFPHETNVEANHRDYPRADVLARECGFDDKNTMRQAWLRRLPYRGVQSCSDKNTKQDFHGLLIDITRIEIQPECSKRNDGSTPAGARTRPAVFPMPPASQVRMHRSQQRKRLTLRRALATAQAA